jgi:small subunit ribosomal protein S24e
MNIIKDFDNRLLNRREIKAVFQMPSNPGFAKAGEMIASQFKANSETIIVKTLKSKFGRDTFLIDALIYDSLKDMEKFEPKKKVKKSADAAPAAPAPAVPAKAEAKK